MKPTQPEIIQRAEFNPKVRNYWLMGGTLTLFLTVIGIPLLPFWWLLGLWITGRYLDHMECTLTKRSLIVKKGFFVRVEKTIPLDKITDLGMIQGPLMRAFGIQAISVETAGQSSQGALVRLHGIVDVEDFRDRVLEQRDRMLEKPDTTQAPTLSQSTASSSDVTADARVVELLTEIRDELRKGQ